LHPATPQIIGIAPPHSGDFTDIFPGDTFNSSLRLDIYCEQHFPGSFSCSESMDFGVNLDPNYPTWAEASGFFINWEEYINLVENSGHWQHNALRDSCREEGGDNWSSASMSVKGEIFIPDLNGDIIKSRKTCNNLLPVVCCTLVPLPEPKISLAAFCGFLLVLLLHDFQNKRNKDKNFI